MNTKPDWLGSEAASAFQEPSVAEAYRYRPPYPNEAIAILGGLIVDAPRTVLDVGCGTGYLARRLADRVDHVDALDVSKAMVEQGKRLPGGDHPNLRWMVGSAEEASVYPPYALITAGDSLHWMDWYVVMPRFAAMLTPLGSLAILGVKQLPAPWEEELWSIRRRYSIIPNFQYFDLIKGLEERELFQRVDECRTEPVTLTQSLDDYIESFHSRAAFPRERMSSGDVIALDNEIGALVAPFCPETVELQIVAEIVWGKPLNREGQV